jgi:hypothetical protein
MFFVYVDYRSDDGEPFYVGKGTSNRVRNRRRNAKHSNVSAKHGKYRIIVHETMDEAEAFAFEMLLIRILGTRDYLGGCNLTDGGEGPSGRVRPPEERARISANTRKPKSSEHAANIAAARTGARHTESSRAKMSASHKGKIPSPECIARASASRLGRPRSEETKAKLSAVHTGKVLSLEHRAKLSLAHKTDAYREKRYGRA